MEWTAEQRQVIEARGSNLIVSAAAGSGKTAVLVERICNLITQDGADITRMLVATFTRAAASEMKGRIVQRLTREASENPAQAHRLNDQLMKIDRASIGTLHSFCGDLLRQYYHVAGIEPTFRTEDESVTQGLYDEALEEAVDSFFEAGDGNFMALGGCWGGRDGSSLKELVSRVYDSARNYPDWSSWLDSAVERFSDDNMELSPWAMELERAFTSCLDLALEALDDAAAIAQMPGGPAAYLTRLSEDRAAVACARDLIAMGNRDSAAKAVCGELFGRLPSWKDGSGTGLGERAKELREEAKKLVRKARENPIAAGLAEAISRTRAMAPQMRALLALVRDFDRRYTGEKRYANVLDFSDLEHLALSVLLDDAVREEAQAAFDYVFVDEYQDISPIQDELLMRISRPGAFFCVGDVKQSIYRFRSAEPEIFIGRLDRSSRQPGAAERRLDLSRNFRSAGRVVRLANFLFENLMSRELGGVGYEGPERLVAGAPQPDVSLRGERCELILIDNEGLVEEELTRLEELIQIEREATVAAGRIRELVGSPVWDGKLKAFRKLRYSDFAVLMRALSGTAQAYAEVFRRAGIPVYCEAEGGFAGELEVELLVNTLRLVDNSLRDYELITAMHSQIGGFSLEDLLEIRGLHCDISFAEAVRRVGRENGDGLAVRVTEFLGRVERWRTVARHGGVEKLVHCICDDTGFRDYAAALPAGSLRQANIDQLAALARGHGGSLYDFVRVFDRLAEGVRTRAPGQSAGAVVLMSVHKSKGLEFPVVILANVGKPMNLMDAGEHMLMHGRLGLGPRYFNAEKRTKADTLARAALRERIRQDTLSEEMRMLYVAVTRARERLIILGTVSDLSSRLPKWSLRLSPAGFMGRARCWADWIGPLAMRTGAGSSAFGIVAEELPGAPEDWDVTVCKAAAIKALKPETVDRAAALKKLTAEAKLAHVPEELAAVFEWRYPFGDVAALPSKVSATSLLDRTRNWRGPIPAPEFRRTPRFLEHTKSFSATDLGTFAHTALQLLPPDASEQDVPALVRDLERRGLLPEGAADAIDISWIARFYRSAIARRMRRSERVLRELPFNLAVPAHVVYAGETSDEEILVQGIIDCCFIEEGKWVLLDYKTNRVDAVHTVEKIAAHYRPQLQTYRAALEEITGIGVREAYLFLLSVGAEAAVML